MPRWVYMIQGDVTEEVSGVDFDIIVMDYTKDGTDDAAQRYSLEALSTIRQSGSKRSVLAYLSIGEAESYRYYFDHRWTDEVGEGRPDPDAPSWLGRANPDWEGNYKAQYWSEEWQRIVLGYVDRLVAYGFDGAYLDIVDGFEYWSDGDNREGCVLTEDQAAAWMIAFVKRIDAHARARRADFVVVPQNGERILGYDTDDSFLETIDAVGVEDLFFSGRQAIEPAAVQERVGYLDKVRAAVKPVMVVDYVLSGRRDTVADEFIAKSKAAGYSPYPAHVDRELDEIVTYQGPGE